MHIYVGADHNGFELKNAVVRYLQERGHQVEDVGDLKLDPDDDFPQFAQRAVQAVLASESPDARAILICGGGQGMAMAANRFRGIRAAVIWDAQEAQISRKDNDSNVLALPARILQDTQLAFQIIDTWLATPFERAARYIRRNIQLDQLPHEKRG